MIGPWSPLREPYRKIAVWSMGIVHSCKGFATDVQAVTCICKDFVTAVLGIIRIVV